MVLGRIVGKAISTHKHSSFIGTKMLLAEPIGAASLDPVLCLDELGASAGDLVVLSNDGKFAREICKDEQSPARWWVMGIIDNEDEVTARLPKSK
jgi:microcompartment protein CcmK/EutM